MIGTRCILADVVWSWLFTFSLANNITTAEQLNTIWILDLTTGMTNNIAAGMSSAAAVGKKPRRGLSLSKDRERVYKPISAHLLGLSHAASCAGFIDSRPIRHMPMRL